MAAVQQSKLKILWKRGKTGYAFLLPFLIMFLLFTIVPIIIGFVLSFTNYSVLETPKFIGLTNYKQLIFDDDIFLIALKNTVVFSVIMGPLGFILSFLLAWIINNLKCKGLFALAVYTPSIASGVAMTTIWSYFFSPDRYGLINNILINMGIIVNPIIWNQDPSTIMPVVILLSIWMGMGTGFLAFMAGLQNISKELLEAGRIDGIGHVVQELWYIIIPQMKPQLLFGAIMAIVNSFGVFDVAVQFAGMPSPNYAAHTIVAHLYDYAYVRFQMGYGSAVAMVLFAITFVLGKVIMKVLKSD